MAGIQTIWRRTVGGAMTLASGTLITADLIARRLKGRSSGRGRWMVHCPTHDDRDPSLSLTERDGKLLAHCFAGCSQVDVVAALKDMDLWPDSRTRPLKERKALLNFGPVVAEYLYRDESGNLLFRVTRHDPKRFCQWRPDGFGGWLRGRGDTSPVLYRLREVVEAPIVFVVEGEKDVESLREHGFVATSSPGGAGKWRDEYNPVFAGKSVIVIPDCDEPGRAHARSVIAGVKPYATRVVVVDLRDDGVKDISEWFQAGHSELELISLVDAVWPHEQVSRG